MSNTVGIEEIREELYLAELAHDTENERQEANRKISAELTKKAAKIVFFGFGTVFAAALSAVCIFFNKVPADIPLIIFCSILAAGSVSLVIMLIVIIKLGTKYYYEGTFASIERSINHSHVVRSLHRQLLEAEHDVELIRTDSEKSNHTWDNVILKKDGKAREYYVSFPKDDNGYTYSECYEFIPRSKPQNASHTMAA